MEKKNHNASLEYREERMLSVAKDACVELLDIKQMQEIVHLLDSTDISEIEVKRADEGLHLALRKFVPPARPPLILEAEPVDTDGRSVSANNQAATPASEASFYHLTASLVGIFHPWLKSNGKTLVAVGDLVKAGQIIGTVEALTLLNEIETTISGRVKEIHVQDGQPVEYGQRLLTIDCTDNADAKKNRSL